MITYLNSRKRLVVSSEEGAIVGRLDDFQFNLAARTIYGYRLKGTGMFSRSGGVSAARLYRIGRDVAFIASESEVEWKTGGTRNVEEGRAWASQYRGTRVMSRGGIAVGVVEDFVFDPEADAIRALILDEGRMVELDERVATGPNAVIIEVEELIRPMPQTDKATEDWWSRIRRSRGEDVTDPGID